jgi:hypothetical protein
VLEDGSGKRLLGSGEDIDGVVELEARAVRGGLKLDAEAVVLDGEEGPVRPIAAKVGGSRRKGIGCDRALGRLGSGGRDELNNGGENN